MSTRWRGAITKAGEPRVFPARSPPLLGSDRRGATFLTGWAFLEKKREFAAVPPRARARFSGIEIRPAVPGFSRKPRRGTRRARSSRAGTRPRRVGARIPRAPRRVARKVQTYRRHYPR